ncbi:hypothetical protein [Spirosoma spitsbergense]|nr:hypothetical protein [Spirosoma spitsbergense]
MRYQIDHIIGRKHGGRP